jgi:hypothetical protein
MSTSFRPAQQRLRQIAAEWPTDPLRPNVQLKTFLTALADHPALSKRAVAATRALHRNQVSDRVGSFDALFSNRPCNGDIPFFLLERLPQIPTPQAVLKPASMPMHYVRLKEGYEKTLRGIGRPWWKIFFGVW